MAINDNDIAFLIEQVRQAGEAEIMPRFRNLVDGDIAEKTSAIDLVTPADLLAEERITKALRQRFPQALVVGEEAYDTDRSVVPALNHAELAFVIDPVDGTFNFAAGLPMFGTILAVVANGETVAGIIHDPILGDTITAVAGGGAHLKRRNGSSKRLKVAAPKPISAMTGIVAWAHMGEPERSRIAGNMAKLRMSFYYNCSAYEYWMLACGKIDFVSHQKLNPWDHLAGLLIHREAGGYSAHYDGSAHRPGEMTGGIIAAADRESWETVRREIIGL
ncbi:inositol monophosphatase family protein [Rhizobium sp. HT1-10]|uniref:inositol monophosphatase family protein n=1 Tax=Rhizobium sp. HT1-10 TaxID=3111638 RepID=UPI003C185AEA